MTSRASAAWWLLLAPFLEVNRRTRRRGGRRRGATRPLLDAHQRLVHDIGPFIHVRDAFSVAIDAPDGPPELPGHRAQGCDNAETEPRRRGSSEPRESINRQQITPSNQQGELEPELGQLVPTCKHIRSGARKRSVPLLQIAFTTRHSLRVKAAQLRQRNETLLIVLLQTALWRGRRVAARWPVGGF